MEKRVYFSFEMRVALMLIFIIILFSSTCFFMVKSVPYGDLMSIGISFEQILNMVNEIAKSKIIFEDYKSI